MCIECIFGKCFEIEPVCFWQQISGCLVLFPQFKICFIVIQCCERTCQVILHISGSPVAGYNEIQQYDYYHETARKYSLSGSDLFQLLLFAIDKVKICNNVEIQICCSYNLHLNCLVPDFVLDGMRVEIHYNCTSLYFHMLE